MKRTRSEGHAIFSCPACNSGNVRISDSRKGPSRADVTALRRRRLCEDCGHKFTTYEVTKEDYDLIPGVRKFLIINKVISWEDK